MAYFASEENKNYWTKSRENWKEQLEYWEMRKRHGNSKWDTALQIARCLTGIERCTRELCRIENEIAAQTPTPTL